MHFVLICQWSAYHFVRLSEVFLVLVRCRVFSTLLIIDDSSFPCSHLCLQWNVYEILMSSITPLRYDPNLILEVWTFLIAFLYIQDVVWLVTCELPVEADVGIVVGFFLICELPPGCWCFGWGHICQGTPATCRIPSSSLCRRGPLSCVFLPFSRRLILQFLLESSRDLLDLMPINFW